MNDKKYTSHIEEIIVHTTASGGRYVRPFDIIRSSAGREVIKNHAHSNGNGNGKHSNGTSSEAHQDLAIPKNPESEE